jgi:hypothetical protein
MNKILEVTLRITKSFELSRSGNPTSTWLAKVLMEGLSVSDVKGGNFFSKDVMSVL